MSKPFLPRGVNVTFERDKIIFENTLADQKLTIKAVYGGLPNRKTINGVGQQTMPWQDRFPLETLSVQVERQQIRSLVSPTIPEDTRPMDGVVIDKGSAEWRVKVTEGYQSVVVRWRYHEDGNLQQNSLRVGHEEVIPYRAGPGSFFDDAPLHSLEVTSQLNMEIDIPFRQKGPGGEPIGR